MASQDDDLQASATEGYKIGEKKTVEEYAKLGRPHILGMASQIEDSFNWISRTLAAFRILPFTFLFLKVFVIVLTIAQIKMTNLSIVGRPHWAYHPVPQ